MVYEYLCSYAIFQEANTILVKSFTRKRKKEVERSKDLCGKIFLHSSGEIRKEYKTGGQILTSDTLADNRIG